MNEARSVSAAASGERRPLRPSPLRWIELLALFVAAPALLAVLPGFLVLPAVLAAAALWLLIVLAYPLLSVYPQEVLFRAFYIHRYGPLFPSAVARIVSSAAVFGYAHLVLHNAPAIALTLVGGLLFGHTYERTRSVLVASLRRLALHGGSRRLLLCRPSGGGLPVLNGPSHRALFNAG
jgi:membrane protease YdiL (CAAX protease family)